MLFTTGLSFLGSAMVSSSLLLAFFSQEPDGALSASEQCTLEPLSLEWSHSGPMGQLYLWAPADLQMLDLDSKAHADLRWAGKAVGKKQPPFSSKHTTWQLGGGGLRSREFLVGFAHLLQKRKRRAGLCQSPALPQQSDVWAHQPPAPQRGGIQAWLGPSLAFSYQSLKLSHKREWENGEEIQSRVPLPG